MPVGAWGRFVISIMFLFRAFSCFAAGELEVHTIDVGQGDATFVRFPGGRTMLVDAGPKDAAQSLVRYLERADVRTIDILVATHPHEDHIGGMRAVLAAFPVGKIWDSGFRLASRTQKDFLEDIRSRGIRFGMPKAGFSETVDGALVRVLAPAREVRGSESDANNNSIVLFLRYGSVSFLLTGDMQQEERRSVGTFPRADVLKIAHHGSRDGTDEVFLGQVAPRCAVIPYGHGNRYGHPDDGVVSMLRGRGVRIFTTADDGNIVFRTDGSGVSVTAAPESHSLVGELLRLFRKLTGWF